MPQRHPTALVARGEQYSMCSIELGAVHRVPLMVIAGTHTDLSPKVDFRYDQKRLTVYHPGKILILTLPSAVPCVSVVLEIMNRPKHSMRLVLDWYEALSYNSLQCLDQLNARRSEALRDFSAIK